MRTALIATGLLLATGLSYCTWNFATAEGRVRALCSSIQPGMPVQQLRDFARAHGLGPAPGATGVNYIVESKSFGRYGCKVLLENGAVKSAEYHFLD